VDGKEAIRVGKNSLYSKTIRRGERNLSAREGSIVGSRDDAVEFTGLDNFSLGEEGLPNGERDCEQNKQDKAGNSRPGNLNGWRHMGDTDPFAPICHRQRTRGDTLTSTQGLCDTSKYQHSSCQKGISSSDCRLHIKREI